MAAAGLRRLGWETRIAECLAIDVMCPAVGQGALAIETRREGDAAHSCARLDDAATRLAVEAERAVLASLGGGCQVPIGAYGSIAGDRLDLVALVASPDGARLIRQNASGPAAQRLRVGEELGRRLLDAGAREILEEVYSAGR
jgi:hydroxymethylbilane synthase